MDKRATVLLLMAALLPVTAVPVAAAEVLAVQSGRPWLHAASGLTIPDEADGFERGRATDYGSTQSDISFNFHDSASKTTATVYIYRAGVPDVSIWTESADAAIHISAEKYFGTLDLAGRKWSRVTPWANSPDSALRIVYPTSGMETKATGLMIARHGDWLIKIRMTTNTLSAAQLEARVASFFTALALPAPKQSVAPAYAIASCTDALPKQDAKLVPSGNGENIMASALANGIISETDELEPAAASAKPTVFCRDAATEPLARVYRAEGSREAYLIAAGDGGVVLGIGPDAGSRLLDPRSRAYSVTLLTSDRQIGFAPYQSMPSPRQVMDSLERARPTYIRSRVPGKEKEIQIIM